MNKKNIYLILGAFSLVFSLSVNAQQSVPNVEDNRDLNRYYCSDEEVEALILNSRDSAIRNATKDRVSIDHFKRQRVYAKAMGANSINDEGKCQWLALPEFREAYQDSMDAAKNAIQGIKDLLNSDKPGFALKMPEIDINEVMSRLADEACQASSDLVDNAQREAKNISEMEFRNAVRNTIFSGFVGDYYLEQYMNDVISDKFTDDQYLEWRGGYDGSIEPREDRADRDVEDRVRNAIKGLF